MARNTAFGTSAQPLSAAAADFDGDGKLDLVFAKRVTADISILHGNGDGTFQAPTNIALGGDGSFVVTGDFNHDGKVDIAAASTSLTGGQVSVFLGNGNGTFKPAIVTTVGQQPVSLAASDFNWDGKLDLVVASISDSNLFVLLGKGDGTFQAPINVPFQHAASVAVGDFNRDGKLDLIATNGSASLFLGNGDGTFQAPTTLILSGAVANFVTVADFNADHKLDVAITMQGGVDVLLGNGDGTFQTATFISYNSPNTPAYLASGDFNGDGKLDLMSADNFDNNVTLLSGEGRRNFSRAD